MPNDNFLPLYETNEGILGKKLNMRRPERTDTQLNLNMNVKAWKNAEIITIIWSRRKQSQMKKKEEELYYDTATLNLKEAFVTIL